MNYENLDYKSAKRLAIKSILVLILLQILASVISVIYFHYVSNRLPENIGIHHHLSYKLVLSEYSNIASKIETDIIVFKKTELLNKFIYRSSLECIGYYIGWYLIFKIVGTKADWARPKLDKTIVRFYQLCWYCRLMYMLFPIILIQILRFFEVIRIGLGLSTTETTILFYCNRSVVFFVLFPISIIAHTISWKKMNLPVFW
jgi:hypothetical protein